MLTKISKNLLNVLLTMLVLAMCIGCSKNKSISAKSGDKIKIVSTIFPEYDWVRNILGANPSGAENIILLDSGIDLHNFQPTVDDILKLSSADLFIYVGGESDKWVESTLASAGNEKLITMNLLELLSDRVKVEEIVEGMQHEHEEHGEHDEHEEHGEHDEHEEHGEHDEHEAHGEHDEEHEHEYDEHVWLSLKNAKVAVKYISDAICQLDPKNKDLYVENTKNYISKLDELDKKYEEVTNSSSIKTILFGDRFPFRYLADDYNLNYYAAFSGCSAETEASFDTILFLSKKVDELSLRTILKIEGSNSKIADTIRTNTKTKDQNILTLDSMQSTTSKDVQEGSTYISTMENNLDVLKKALE